jgi:hypothetical protein
VFSGRILKVDKLPQLEWINRIDNWKFLYCVSLHPLTATTTDLGIGLNGKMVLYLGIFGKSEELA